MEMRYFKCPKHPQEQITFFCTVNQWHFTPLCNACVPAHTQAHPKNFKIHLESYPKVHQHIDTSLAQTLPEYSARLARIEELLGSQAQPVIFEMLDSAEEQAVGVVRGFFQGVRKELGEAREGTVHFQRELLTRLKENVLGDIKEMEVSDKMGYQKGEQGKGDQGQEGETKGGVDQWGEIVRRMYFKDGMKPYLDEIDDILKQHEERVYKKQMASIDLPKLVSSVKKSLQSCIIIHRDADKQKQKEKQKEKQKQKQKNAQKQGKKQVKIPQKSKICKQCNGELEYLTNLKKHLFCPNCGGKERNYTKKP